MVSGFEEECAALVQAVTEHTPLPERLAYIGLTGENTDVSVRFEKDELKTISLLCCGAIKRFVL